MQLRHLREGLDILLKYAKTKTLGTREGYEGSVIVAYEEDLNEIPREDEKKLTKLGFYNNGDTWFFEIKE